MILCRAAMATALLSATAALPAKADEATLTGVNREVGIAASGQYLHYQEYGPTDILDKNVGWTPGFAARASTMVNSSDTKNFYASLNYQFNRDPIAAQ